LLRVDSVYSQQHTFRPGSRRGALNAEAAGGYRPKALAPHLNRADPDGLGDVVTHLTDVDGGVAALGDALAGLDRASPHAPVVPADPLPSGFGGAAA
jgi:hypothetical protein